MLSELEAALEFKMSPTLLKWFTKNGVGKERKKLNFVNKDGAYFYKHADLVEFNAYLLEKWSTSAADRPDIPKGIKDEIEAEANYVCVVCSRHNTLEYAHIDPYNKCLHHHPQNLLYLCSTDHDSLDKTSQGATFDTSKALLRKAIVLDNQMRTWRMLIEKDRALVVLISAIAKLQERVQEAKEEVDKKFLDFILSKDVEKLVAEAKRIQRDAQADKDLLELAKEVQRNTENPNNREIMTLSLVKAKDNFTRNTNENECPVCEGKGWALHYDVCPPCGGDGSLSKNALKNEDFTKYTEFKTCPICDGNGSTSEYDLCPPCGGQGVIPRYLFDETDFTMYSEKYDCPVCKGKGSTKDYETCPACGGKGELSKGDYHETDFSLYTKFYDCDLCEGSGSWNHSDCPACGGEGTMPKYIYQEVDFSTYTRMLTCRLCNGTGKSAGHDECVPCAGEGKIPEIYFDRIDWSQYKLVKCPICKGIGTYKSDDCRACSGEGELPAYVADQIDSDDYK
jgi:DnaJ-class molecular chaperone